MKKQSGVKHQNEDNKPVSFYLYSTTCYAVGVFFLSFFPTASLTTVATNQPQAPSSIRAVRTCHMPSKEKDMGSCSYIA